jgi:serine/threonine protein kinase
VQIEQIKALFQDALDLPAGSDWITWLKARTGDDHQLFDEVSSLIRARAAMQQAEPIESLPAASVPANLFGAYRAVGLLGRGGTSAVYRAERADGQYRQTVALKVMAGHLTGPEFLRRFETERQLLASLNHPNITHLLDGGIAESGEPFLVMEYVEGERLDDYCDRLKLGLPRRLALFGKVCEAVEYAHRNLIVHGDLKPNNILATADGDVKLLDFGTGVLLDAAREFTVTRTRMLTPRYASPERLRGERATPAHDVFSLGILLYELLTGAWPFGDPGSMLRELQRAMDDAAVLAPVNAVSDEAADARGLTAERLRRLLKGDLSAIMLKALESDASLRYRSVRDFQEDLERYLNGLPVRARVQTALYRAGKLARRRWLPISAALLLAVSLSTASIVAIAETRAARAQAAKAYQVSAILKDVLSSAAGHGNLTVMQMLEEAEPKLERAWADDPRTEAELRLNLGASYVSLSKPDRAIAQLQRALTLFRTVRDYQGAAIALYLEGQNFSELGQIARAIALYRQGLHDLSRLGKDVPKLWQFRLNLMIGGSLLMLDQFEEARPWLAAAIETGAAARVEAWELASADARWGSLLAGEGKFDEAEEMFEKALIRVPRDYTLAEVVRGARIMVAEYRGDFVRARDLARLDCEHSLQTQGPARVWSSIRCVGWARYRAETGEIEPALMRVRDELPKIREVWNRESDYLWVPLTQAAHVMLKANRFAEADRYARKALHAAEIAGSPANSPWRAEATELLGSALMGERNPVEGLRLLSEAQRMYAQCGPAWSASARRLAEAARLSSDKAQVP